MGNAHVAVKSVWAGAGWRHAIFAPSNIFVMVGPSSLDVLEVVLVGLERWRGVGHWERGEG